MVLIALVENARKEGAESMDLGLTSKVNTLSMFFKDRAKIYKKLKTGEDVEGFKYDLSQTVPHYLMYTTIGRADLVMFESSIKKRQEKYQKMMEE